MALRSDEAAVIAMHATGHRGSGCGRSSHTGKGGSRYSGTGCGQRTSRQPVPSAHPQPEQPVQRYTASHLRTLAHRASSYFITTNMPSSIPHPRHRRSRGLARAYAHTPAVKNPLCNVAAAARELHRRWRGNLTPKLRRPSAAASGGAKIRI
jgi:hypothetical protein